MQNQIVILAAGKGKRMNSSDMPKVLVPLKGKPVILYLLDQVNQLTQLIKPVIVVGFMKEKVREFLGDAYLYATQEKQLGTAHAVMAAKEKVNAENILVLYGDMPFVSANSLRKLLHLHRQSGNNLSMFTSIVENFEGVFGALKSYGRIIRDKSGEIVKITEYKDATEEERERKEVNPGIYCFKTSWLWDKLEKIENHNSQGEYYLTDLVEIAIKEGLKISSLKIDPKEVLGINTLQDLEEAEKIA